jgi:hypothetical protein
MGCGKHNAVGHGWPSLSANGQRTCSSYTASAHLDSELLLSTLILIAWFRYQREVRPRASRAYSHGRLHERAIARS